MAKQKRRLAKLLDADPIDIDQMSDTELRSAWKSAAASLRGRISGFRSKGRMSALPVRYRKGVPTVESFESAADMRRSLKSALGYLRGSASRVAGYEEYLKSRRESVGQKIGFEFESQEQYESYGHFLDEMGERLGSMWQPASDFVQDLWKQSQRLNLDPNQLMKNYEYWRDHLDDLKEMDPIEGRSRDLRPSDYIKKAKLENITDYYKDPKHFNKISSAARKPSRGRQGNKK